MNGRIIKLILVIVMMGISRAGWAVCWITGGAWEYNATVPAQTIPATNTPGPIGSVIDITPDGQGRTVSCFPSTGMFKHYIKYGTAMPPAVISGHTDVYQTNVPGIGVRIWTVAQSGAPATNDLMKWGETLNYTEYLRAIKMQYYVIGPVTAGIKTFNDITVESWINSYFSTNIADSIVYNRLTIQSAAVTIQTPSCTTPSIKVPLGKHSRSDFSGVNSTSAREVPFTFAINDCDPGINTVHYTFRPAAGVSVGGSGATEHLTLDSSSSASGVGIQVLYNSGAGTTLVPLNTKTQFTGYTAGGSTFTIPMKARYIQTAGTVTAGSANSAIEFTMSYE